MIPPRILSTFRSLPNELIGLCRPHTREQLTIPPADGMRSIWDILTHLVGVEARWIGHVVLGRPRERLLPEAFKDLDDILAFWNQQREATISLVGTLTAAERMSRRAFPWDPNESTSVEEIIWHVVTHEQYHRGQVFTRLALLGRRDLPDHDMLR